MVIKGLDYVTAMSSIDTEKRVVQFRFVTNVKHSIKCLSTRRVLFEQQNYNVRTHPVHCSSYKFIHSFCIEKTSKTKTRNYIETRASVCLCLMFGYIVHSTSVVIRVSEWSQFGFLLLSLFARPVIKAAFVSRWKFIPILLLKRIGCCKRNFLPKLIFWREVNRAASSSSASFELHLVGVVCFHDEKVFLFFVLVLCAHRSLNVFIFVDCVAFSCFSTKRSSPKMNFPTHSRRRNRKTIGIGSDHCQEQTHNCICESHIAVIVAKHTCSNDLNCFCFVQISQRSTNCDKRNLHWHRHSSAIKWWTFSTKKLNRK